MDNGSTLEFDDKVKELYELLHAHETTIVSPVFPAPELSHPESKHIGTRHVLYPFAVAMVIAVVWWIFDPGEWLKIVVLLLTLVGYVGIVAIQLLELYAEKGSILQFLKNPLAVFTSNLIEEVPVELKLVTELKKFSSASLELVKRSLETGHQAISHRIGIMVGAMEKIGLLPGLVTLYLAASNKGSHRFAVSVALVMFGVYVFAFAIHHALPRLYFYRSLIDFELARRKNEF